MLVNGEADLSVYAAELVAVPRGLAETVEVTLADLPSPIERSEGFLEAYLAQSMGIAVVFRKAFSPGDFALDALVHHETEPFSELSVRSIQISAA
jgi:hypothetical protein